MSTDLFISIDFRKNRERREYLEFDGHLLITYLNERESPHYIKGLGRGIRNNQTSIIRLTVQHLEVFENGSLSDPFGLVVEGYIGWERVGDFLPIDYYPESKYEVEKQ